MSKPIVNVADLEFSPRPAAFAATGKAAEVFDAKTAFVSPRLGAQKLGYNVTVVPPGKAAFPFHSHRANEELFFILQGTGVARIGAETFPIRAGDFIACPPGGPETAHQIRNTGDEELRYISISTMIYPEVAEYPDSGKFGVYARGLAPTPAPPKDFRYVGRESLAVGYWEGEGETRE